MNSIGNMEVMENVLSDMRMRCDEAYATYLELLADCSSLERLMERERGRAGMGSMVVEPHKMPPPDGIPTCTGSVPQPAQEPLDGPESEERSEVADDEEVEDDLEVPEEAGLPAGKLSSGYPLDLDVSRAETRMDMIRILAKQLPGRTFKVEDAAQWLIDIGASSSGIKNLKSAFYAYAKGRTDYRKIGPGVFQYVGYGEAQEVIPFGATYS